MMRVNDDCGRRNHPMTDLKSPTLIYAKGFLFLLTGLVAAALVLAEAPSLRLAALLAIAIWCFCRCYYFAFYVIEHYVDSSYRFAGLTSFAMYLLRSRSAATAASDRSAEVDETVR
jgi:hypothetical protein